MNDQLIIGDKASFDDFEASLATRNIGMPTPKTIKETVPFSNVTYDFSRINGEQYWEERELEFVFEIIANTPERLEELKTAFAGWVMNVFQEDIHDPFIPYHHFVGTFADIEFADEESLDKTTVTVKFEAYPYKVANQPKVSALRPNTFSGYRQEFAIVNESSHRIFPTLKLEFDEPNENSLSVIINGVSYDFHDGKTVDQIPLPVGVSVFRLVSLGATGYTLTVSFVEEVF